MKCFALITLFSIAAIGTASSLESILFDTVIENGLEEAIILYHNESDLSDSGIELEVLRILAQNLRTEGQFEAARAFLHLNMKAYPESIQPLTDLAVFTFSMGERDSSRIYIGLAEELDPFLLSTVILRKRIFFIADEFSYPKELETANFYIRPIRGSDAEMDYPAVMSSISHIRNTMGSRSWPSEELTLEEDRTDLARHEGEMERGEAFVYTVMNKTQTEILGCIYIFTSRLDHLDAEIAIWTTLEAFENGLDSVLFQEVQNWINNEWPFEEVVYPGRSISFQEFYTSLGEQDEKYH